MTNDTALRVDTAGDDDLRQEGEGKFEVPTYELDPADRTIADEILAMDPVSDVPGPFSGLESKLTVEPKLTSLPPALRSKVERQLAMVPPSRYAESEREFVAAALKEHSLSVRTQTGVAGTALPLHKEQAELANQFRSLANRFDAISGELLEVREFTNGYDEMGNRIPVPTYVHEGAAREALVREQEQLSYHMNLLKGLEGQRRLQKALKESVAVLKARREAAADEKEVQTRAEAIVRESRIARRAATRAKMIDPDVAA